MRYSIGIFAVLPKVFIGAYPRVDESLEIVITYALVNYDLYFYCFNAYGSRCQIRTKDWLDSSSLSLALL